MYNNFHQQKEFFFDLWAAYYDSLFTTFFYQAIHQKLLEYVYLKENTNVLDLGCGTGLLLKRLVKKFPQIQGIGSDISSSMLEEANLKNEYREKIAFVKSKAESLCFKDKQFDAIFCTISFLHYSEPEKVFYQVNRVLKDGGVFYLVDIYGWLADIFGREKGYSSYIPLMGEVKLYNQQQRERLASESELSCLSHSYLLPEVLLSIFVKPIDN